MAVKNPSAKLTTIIKVPILSFEENIENMPQKDIAPIKRKIRDFTLS